MTAQPAPAAASGKQPDRPGHRLADDGWGAVRRIETVLCGANVARSAATAEGMGAAGVRAACLLDSDSDAAPVHATSAIVYHFGGIEPPFEAPLLAAGSHQALVDLALVAHLLATRTGRPVGCLVDPPLGDRLGWFEIPSSGLTGELLGSGDEAPTRRPAGALTEVRAAFKSVAGALERPCDAVSGYRLEEAEHVLVATGASVEPGLRLVDALREKGESVGLLAVRLVSPFPTREVAERLSGAGSAVLLPSAHPRLRAVVGPGLNRAARRASVSLAILAEPEKGFPSTAARLAQALAGLQPEAPAWRIVPEEPGLHRSCGVVPAGPWARRLLLDFATTLVGDDAICRERRPQLALAGPRDRDEQLLDALILMAGSEPAAVSVVAGLGPGAQVVIPQVGASSEETWERLPETLKAELRSRDAAVWVLPADLREARWGPERLRQALLGALVRIFAQALPELSADEWCARFPDLSDPAAFTDGMTRLAQLGPEVLNREPDPLLVLSEDLPLRPADPEPPSDADPVTEGLRGFHLTGQGPESPAGSAPDATLRPAVVYQLATSPEAVDPYPFYLPEPAGDPAGARPLAVLLGEAMEAADREFPVLRDHLDIVTSGVLCPAGRCRLPLRPVLDESLSRLGERFDLSEAGSDELAEEVAALAAALPATGELLFLSPESSLQLYLWTLARDRSRHAEAFRDEIRTLVAGLESILLVERSHSEEALSPEALSAGVGQQGSHFIDSESLARALPASRGPRKLSSAQRAEIEQLLDELRRFAAAAPKRPALYLVHSAELDTSLPAGVEALRHEDGFAAALGLFEGLMQRWLPVWRAARRARLEVDRSYDPEVHRPQLDRLQWQSCSAEELLAAPPILVAFPAGSLSARLPGSFGRLLGSGRPVQILIEDNSPGALEELSGPVLDLAYLGIAYREALVSQGSPADPLQLAAQMKSQAVGLRTGLLVAARAGGRLGDPIWLRQLAATAARVHPVCSYDPGAGPSWARRFSLEGNPQPESIWPCFEVSFRSPDGDQTSELQPLTPAHALALYPDYRKHYCVIPTEWWRPDQVEVASYLDAWETLPPDTIPYIWVVGPGQLLQRAVLTRDLAHLCRDRSRLWRILQELGGIENAYVSEAVERVRQELAADFEAQSERLRQEALEEGARLAVDRLVEGLIGGASPGASTAASPVQPPPPEVEEQGTGVAPADQPSEAAPAAAEPAREDPYIDSYLCTSCNECTQINPRLFKYNDDQQAYIADVEAGSYAELVKAAEECPANCIHPGSPRAGDETATEEIRARAAALG